VPGESNRRWSVGWDRTIVGNAKSLIVGWASKDLGEKRKDGVQMAGKKGERFEKGNFLCKGVGREGGGGWFRLCDVITAIGVRRGGTKGQI